MKFPEEVDVAVNKAMGYSSKKLKAKNGVLGGACILPCALQWQQCAWQQWSQRCTTLTAGDAPVRPQPPASGPGTAASSMHRCHRQSIPVQRLTFPVPHVAPLR